MTPTPALTEAEVVALQLPAAATARQPRALWRTLAAGFGLGLLSRWFGWHDLGVSAPLFVLACIGAMRWAGGREAWQAAKRVRWLLFSGFFFSAFVAVRDSSAMAALNLLGAGWCGLAALASWNGATAPDEWSLVEFVSKPLLALVKTVPAGTRVSVAVVTHPRARTWLGAWAWPTFRAALIVPPVLLVFFWLLRGADAAFRARADDWFSSLDVSALTVVSWAWVAFVGFIMTGALSSALARRVQPSAAAQPKAPSTFKLGALEAFSLVGSVAGLLTLFDAVSLECAVSASSCVLPADATYAEYVHEGFGQLLAVAGLVLVLLLGVPKVVRLPSGRHERAMQWLSTVLVAAALPLVSSALTRLELYEGAYGYTVQRVFAQAVMGLVGAWLVLRGVTLWVWPKRFAFGAMLASFAVLSALNVLDVERFVARQNVQRFEQQGLIDDEYLARLSADAAPELVPFEERHPERRPLLHVRGDVFENPPCTDGSWLSWSWACARVE